MPLPPGFVPPCLPSNAPQPPSGATWVHEIKHDGFRVIARKDGERVRLYSRPGNDVSKRLGSRYRSGRSPDWLKMKNPEAPAVKREAEEDWGRGGRR